MTHQQKVYAKKVFIGGLGHLQETDIITFFSQFGKIRSIIFPLLKNRSVQQDETPLGFAHVIFYSDESVNELMKHVFVKEGRTFVQLTNSSASYKKIVEVKPWKLADSYYQNSAWVTGYPFKVAVMGINPRMAASELAKYLNRWIGEACYVELHTRRNQYYPLGSGLIRFCTEDGFENALALRKFGNTETNCQFKPFICKNNYCLCQQKAACFCLSCKQYVCNTCYIPHYPHDEKYKYYIKRRYESNYELCFGRDVRVHL